MAEMGLFFVFQYGIVQSAKNIQKFNRDLVMFTLDFVDLKW